MQEQAQDHLIEEGVVHVRTEALGRALGCLSCIWGEAADSGAEPRASAQQVMRCNGRRTGDATFPDILRKLAGGQAIAMIKGPRPDGERGSYWRPYYHPADNAVGKGLVELMTRPEQCGQKPDTLTPLAAAADVEPASRPSGCLAVDNFSEPNDD